MNVKPLCSCVPSEVSLAIGFVLFYAVLLDVDSPRMYLLYRCCCDLTNIQTDVGWYGITRLVVGKIACYTYGGA